MIRVLLIPSSDYLGHPFPQRHNHLFERLHDEKEFEVHVIRFNIFKKARLKTKCIIHEIPFEIKIQSTAAYYLANIPLYINEIMKIIRNEAIDIVVAGNLLPPFLYCLLEKLTEKKIPFIFDLQDYYPISAAGYILSTKSSLSTIIRGLFEIITQTLIKKANAVTVPGIALAMYAKEVGAKHVHLIPNGISEHFLKQHDGTKIRNKLGYKENDIVVGYVGSVEFWLDMEPLIKAIAKANKQGVPVKLLLIGKHLQTGYARKVKKWIEKHGIAELTTWLSFIPHEKVPEYIAAMDIGTIPFDVNNLTAYYAAPNKMWEYLSQGKIVASTPIPESIANKDKLFLVRNEDDYCSLFKTYMENPLNSIKIFLKRCQNLKSRCWTSSVHKLKQILYKAASKRK